MGEYSVGIATRARIYDVAKRLFSRHRIERDQFEGDTSDDLVAEAVARQLRLGYIKAPFAFTGGNVLNDGVNTIFSTEVLIAVRRSCRGVCTFQPPSGPNPQPKARGCGFGPPRP